MRIIRYPIRLPPCVMAIGHFDGMHRGHQAVISRLIAHKQRLGLPARVLTFQQDPQWTWGHRTPMVMRLVDKWRYLAQLDVDEVVCIRFDKRFAAYTPADFLQQGLQACWQVRAVVVGADFRFGAGRQGSFSDLQAWGVANGVSIEGVPDCVDPLTHTRISSTRLRAALQDFDPIALEAMLGRPYACSGRVIAGRQQARTWGTPTLNMVWPPEIPLRGVFAVTVQGLEPDQRLYRGVANIGTRPTVAGSQLLLEVHVLDWSGNAYGRRVQVAFAAKLRDEKKFDTLNALQDQIQQDLQAAQQVWLRLQAEIIPERYRAEREKEGL